MNYLPVVNPEVSHSLRRELCDKFDEPYLKEQLQILKEKNPVIAKWIKSYGKTTDDKLGAMYCGLMVYKLLESQAEANQMAEDIKLG